jgi:hypothetical protein
MPLTWASMVRTSLLREAGAKSQPNKPVLMHHSMFILRVCMLANLYVLALLEVPKPAVCTQMWEGYICFRPKAIASPRPLQGSAIKGLNQPLSKSSQPLH